MIDFKTPLDAVNAADAALKAKAAEIASMGADELTANAEALQNSLDALQADYDKKLALYQGLVKATAPSAVNQLFVPASETPADPEAAKPTDTLTLAEFNQLSPRDRLAFAKRDGKIQEKED